MQPLDNEQCRRARLSRDARFDGQFFIAVSSTGIFCRPVCPANPPKESNVTYYRHPEQALAAGFRPCLRCHPDSAPGSNRWQGVETTVRRAVRLIEEGSLQHQNTAELAERLGISDRYLRKLFQQQIGMSVKQYAQLQQLLLAKQLLHSSDLPIQDVALACGFNSVRRFNDAFRKHLQLTPSACRRQLPTATGLQQLTLTAASKLNWSHLLSFYHMRAVDGVEEVTDQSYGRTLLIDDAPCWFRASPVSERKLQLEFKLSNMHQLRPLLSTVRRILDLETNTEVIEAHLAVAGMEDTLLPGIRIPGVLNPWEAGVRAVLGQQISVKAAITQLNGLVSELGTSDPQFGRLFPTPEQVMNADLSFLKMPDSRRQTVRRLAEFVHSAPTAHPQQWLDIKGIGPWTVHYARLRGLSEPDCFLATDLVVRKVLAQLPKLDVEALSPWGSYATFHCWSAAS